VSNRRIGEFLTAAVLVRCMDAGATVGMVLLCTASHLSSPLRTAGLVGAALTAPHALGFLSAPLLDRGADPRRIVAAAAALFATLLAAATTVVGIWPLPILLLLAAAAGSAGPMLTGGLSGLADRCDPDARTGRMPGLDALTYGLAATGAPVVVSALAAVVSPRGGLLALCALGLVGALLILRLPAERSSPTPLRVAAQPAPPRDDTARTTGAARAGPVAIWGDVRLRRVALLTWLGAFVVAAALLAGMSLAQSTGPGRGGWVAAAFGLGGLVGGLALTARPLQLAPERGMVLFVGALAPVLVVAACLGARFAILVASFAVLGVLVAPQTVLSLTARGEYAPPEARGSVFVTVAGTKVAFSSAGTATAGLGAAWGSSSTLLAVAALAFAASALGCVSMPRSARVAAR
jgi:hypothetical protein